MNSRNPGPRRVWNEGPWRGGWCRNAPVDGCDIAMSFQKEVARRRELCATPAAVAATPDTVTDVPTSCRVFHDALSVCGTLQHLGGPTGAGWALRRVETISEREVEVCHTSAPGGFGRQKPTRRGGAAPLVGSYR